MYKVVRDFADMQDNGFIYRVGDEFPRKGVEVSEKRIAELSTTDNKIGDVLIEKVIAKKTIKKEEVEEDAVEEKPKRNRKK